MKPEHDEILSTQQSLAIITEMISNTQRNLGHHSVYFLLWGVVIAVANLAMFILIQAEYPHPYIAWTLAIPAWVATIVIGIRQSKKSLVTNHLDRISMWLWFSFGVIIFTVVIFGRMINYQINPVILLISAVPTAVSGVIIRFRPLIVGGVCFWIFGTLCFLVGSPWQYALGAVGVTLGHVLPGILLRRNKER